MNPDDIFQNLQKGFRITLGATSTVLESIQDSQRREEALNQLRTDPVQLAEELAVKGEATEREARAFVDNLLAQQSGSASAGSSSASASAKTPTAPPEVETDLKELTQKISELRAELEKLRQQEGS